ncbi:urease accessory protein UreD [Cellulomonas citrea]|uniref:urease accessory protein UreD n=1 Tax=Cellulomonas citrea TaxID=1909423 RepID=UPI001359466F|nr:urease accessory protein UreD [Cellulomonas citrea]
MSRSETVVEALLADGRVRLDLVPGPWSPRLLQVRGGAVRVALVATGALLLGGDDVALRVRVGRGVELELVEVSGTVAYDGRGRGARWSAQLDVDGVLVWDALPFVVADGADLDRRTRVRLGAGACACLRDTLVLGRSGEAGVGVVRQDLRVDGVDGPVLVEQLRVDGSHALPGVLGPHRVVDQVLLAGARPPHAGPGLGGPDDGPATVLDLDRPGALVRALGADAHTVDLGAWATGWAEVARAAGRASGVIDPAASSGPVPAAAGQPATCAVAAS